MIGFLGETILGMFANLNPVQVEKFVHQFFNTVDDWKAFKGSVRDLMICTKSFSSQQNDFYDYEAKVSSVVDSNKYRSKKKKLSRKSANENYSYQVWVIWLKASRLIT